VGICKKNPAPEIFLNLQFAVPLDVPGAFSFMASTVNTLACGVKPNLGLDTNIAANNSLDDILDSIAI